MRVNELYDFAENRDILFLDAPLARCPSLSLLDNGDCTIVIDHRQIISRADEKVKAAHEIGHCETGAFYNEHSLETRSRCEYRADKWAIKKLIPEDELLLAFKNGIVEAWELAELFDVTESFVKKACKYYGFCN